ncbi:MAG: hypothetical protein QOE68_2738, partial [Thermoanaerobaculia bacterium]|nr:hypothetical protein [Thermoanaerobaculia bacterium]
QEASLLAADAGSIASEAEFHRRLFDIVKRLRDRHTAMRLPSPWQSMVAFLPFAVESYLDQSGRHLIVSKLLADVGDPEFRDGVEITHWNGVPIDRFLETFSWSNDGAHVYARIAIALRTLTVRSLGFEQPPEEDWVALTFRTFGGAYGTVVIPWRVYLPSPGTGAATASAAPATGAIAFLQGVDRNTLIVNATWKDLFARGGADAATSAPQNVASKIVPTSSGEFGYIRVFSFDAPDSAGFVAYFAGLLRQMPPNGVIIDLRANPGGTIPSGEGLLSLFTNRMITPQPLSFRSTTAVRTVAQASLFVPWRRSLDIRLETGEVFSQGFAVTPESLGPSGVYLGPVVLIIDALCYSTTDFFAAGMQDNGLAAIIGVDPVTGAGGANVWTYGTLSSLLQQGGGQELLTLPAGYDINVAVRRSLRVGPNAGLPVEGLGVRADVPYNMTRRDVLSANEDLIEFAGRVLASEPVRSMRRQ